MRQRALPLQRQHVVLHGHVDIFLFHAREICHENEGVVVLQQVHPWSPLGRTDAGRLRAPREGFEEPVHLVTKRLEAFKGTPRLLEWPPRHGRMPSHHCHCTSPFPHPCCHCGSQTTTPSTSPYTIKT